ncbi:hypothetical protein SAMD00019534_047840 [Acytostelium subglobosum LB1]|uniref:hypothetical protein n=1 Tax=Acytostelium subglobosum LB1 TaxID=1410327 RepID=UPI000644C440|nr:hypothetical protein SAMD00019534_047840 [Acytostelium subglobosum LB1]GAM21609.1 hypothetical protein SAMD00019534_047840 [Acytostelium subglobosum LB1]|eukprot:XP_012755728.1 hypothetical protein SAMD00019534_047840 [Acytostelium subglobosum LB1]
MHYPTYINIRNAVNPLLLDYNDWTIDFDLDIKMSPKDKIMAIIDDQRHDIIEKCCYVLCTMRCRDRLAWLDNEVETCGLESGQVDRILVFALLYAINGQHMETRKLLVRAGLNRRDSSPLHVLMQIVEFAGRLDHSLATAASDIEEGDDEQSGLLSEKEQRSLSGLFKTLPKHSRILLLQMYSLKPHVLVDWVNSLDPKLQEMLGLTEDFFVNAIYMTIPNFPIATLQWLHVMVAQGRLKPTTLNNFFIDVQSAIVASDIELRTIFDALLSIRRSLMGKLAPGRTAVDAPTLTDMVMRTINGKTLSKDDYTFLLDVVQRELTDDTEVQAIYHAMFTAVLRSRHHFHNRLGLHNRLLAILHRSNSLEHAKSILEYICSQPMLHDRANLLATEVLESLLRPDAQSNTSRHLNVSTLQSLAESITLTHLRCPLIRRYALQLDHATTQQQPDFYQLFVNVIAYDLRTSDEVVRELLDKGLRPTPNMLSHLIKQTPNAPWHDISQRYNLDIKSSHFIPAMKKTGNMGLVQGQGHAQEIDGRTFTFILCKHIRNGDLEMVQKQLDGEYPADLKLIDIIHVMEKYPSLPLTKDNLRRLLEDDHLSKHDYPMQVMLASATNNGHLPIALGILKKLRNTMPPHIIDQFTANLIVAAAETDADLLFSLMGSDECDLKKPILRHAALFAASRAPAANIRQRLPHLATLLSGAARVTNEELSFVAMRLGDASTIARLFEGAELSTLATYNVLIGLLSTRPINYDDPMLNQWLATFIKKKPTITMMEGVFLRMDRKLIEPHGTSNTLALDDLMQHAGTLLFGREEDDGLVEFNRRLLSNNTIPMWCCMYAIKQGSYDVAIRVALEMVDMVDKERVLTQVKEAMSDLSNSNVWMSTLLGTLSTSTRFKQKDFERYYFSMASLQPIDALNMYDVLEEGGGGMFVKTNTIIKAYHIALAQVGSFDNQCLPTKERSAMYYVADVINRYIGGVLTPAMLTEITRDMAKHDHVFTKSHYQLMLVIMSRHKQHSLLDLLEHMIAESCIDFSNDRVALDCICASSKKYLSILQSRLFNGEKQLVTYRLLNRIIDEASNNGDPMTMSALHTALLYKFPTMYDSARDFHDIVTRTTERQLNFNVWSNHHQHHQNQQQTKVVRSRGSNNK